ncbi:hypothetical protein PpBr36_00097 [Pyricularia pennisetigena]|uniref:hypothetical protein n=1 Tax=Pyricularia pennisetigena TaxID=1578925 RepID=UPI00114E8F18|nr:hypothetical protein PpBr36_00097 [Pyricularia pennisetigena]TLS27991.1 hypothetical protein PpBr36_00097 [Pyricularia pennisetigena]
MAKCTIVLEGHLGLAKVCLKYLAGKEMQPTRGNKTSKRKVTLLERTSAFAAYATTNFSVHLVNYRPEHNLVQNWGIDLIRIVAKFGHDLLLVPESMITLLPVVCPTTSCIRRQYYSTPASDLRVRGEEVTEVSFNSVEIIQIWITRVDEAMELTSSGASPVDLCWRFTPADDNQDQFKLVDKPIETFIRPKKNSEDDIRVGLGPGNRPRGELKRSDTDDSASTAQSNNRS